MITSRIWIAIKWIGQKIIEFVVRVFVEGIFDKIFH